MNSTQAQASTLIRSAYLALRQGDRTSARRLASHAAALAPDREEPWLIMAAIASPQGSLEYLKQALKLNPSSPNARKGIHWAMRRLQSDEQLSPIAIRTTRSGHGLDLRRKSPVFVYKWLPLLLAVVILCPLAFLWLLSPQISKAILPSEAAPLAVANFTKATRTPTNTPTYSPTPTPTATPTATHTPTVTPTSTPTDTPTSTPTEAPPSPEPPPDSLLLPAGVGKKERWIEVNLTNQTAAAYQGKKLIRSFIISSGTWQHPTVTGQYRIYVKYRFADMAGPGYFLPDVPNVMYFYKGYGLHGTYWHNNFGTPMSHGCVNFTIEDSAWLFEFASVGTVVYVHD